MQDRFVGDVGDFGKYGLLRALTGIHPEAQPRLSLGVVWYTPTGIVGSPGDGTHIGYLDRPWDYRSCDPSLFDSLGQMFQHQRQSLAEIRRSQILDNATFVEEAIPWGMRARDQWLLSALRATQESALVFLDPDKGLAPPSAAPDSPEHTRLHEVGAFVERGQTVIIYHHLGRTFEGRGASHPEQMRGWAQRLKAELSLSREPKVLWYRRGTARAYFVLPGERHEDTIALRLEQFERSRWYDLRHFTALRNG